jgi:hypothetical protein
MNRDIANEHFATEVQRTLQRTGHYTGRIDGWAGPATLAAFRGAIPIVAAPLAARVPSGLVRIILHWTAGGGHPTAHDRKYYHYLIDSDGKAYDGNLPPTANISTKDGGYAEHTMGCNAGSIGIAFCGMRGAIERPFAAGPSPLTRAQIDIGAAFVAGVADRYGIPITPRTVLSHAEVQPTLGIAQEGKWDISWLPGMAAPGDPVAVGNTLRALISQSR